MKHLKTFVMSSHPPHKPTIKKWQKKRARTKVLALLTHQCLGSKSKQSKVLSVFNENYIIKQSLKNHFL